MSFLRVSLGAAGLLALSGCFVACGDDDKTDGTPDSGETGGGSSTGGKGSGGSGSGGTEAGAGGASSGGTTEAGAGGSAGEGGPGPTDGGGAGGGDGAVGDGGGMSVAKFCNDVAIGSGQNQQSVTFRITIGEGASAVTLTAASGTCSPAVNLPCTAFAAGTDIPVDMVDMDDTTRVLDSISIDSVDGEQWIFAARIDDTGTSPRPAIRAYDPPTGSTCSAADYDDLPQELQASSRSGSGGRYVPAR